MGGCATKPKVLKGDDAPDPQVPEGQTSKEEAKREPGKESKPRETVNVEQQSHEEVVAEDRGKNRAAEINDISNKANEIVGGDDKVEEQGGTRRSLSLLFNKESKDSDDVVTQDDNAAPEELKRQEPMEAEKIIGEAQNNESLKQEATNNEKSSDGFGKDKEVPLETPKAPRESESIDPVKHEPAELDPPVEIVKNELPTEPHAENAENVESSGTSLTKQEPGDMVKLSNDLVKEDPSDVNETEEPDTKFVEAETKLEEPSNDNETSGQSDKFVEAETKLEESSNDNETSRKSDTKCVEVKTKLEESSNVNEASRETETKLVEAETVENPVEQTGAKAEVAPPEKDVPEHTNQSAVEIQSADKIAKETTETSDGKKISRAPDSESFDVNDKTSGEPHSESFDVNKTSEEPDSRVPEVKPLEKPVEPIELAVALAPSVKEATEHNNQSAAVIQNDDKLANAITE